MTDNSKYNYDRFGSKGMRVGQAVYDTYKKQEKAPTVEDVLDGFTPQYEKAFYECVETGYKKHGNKPFFILVFSNKEPWAVNMQRCWFIDRNTQPNASAMIEQYPNYFKTLYKVEPQEGQFKILWSIPGMQDCISILKNPSIYDPQLISWIEGAFNQRYDLSDALVA